MDLTRDAPVTPTLRPIRKIGASGPLLRSRREPWNQTLDGILTSDRSSQSII
jgi:hypothetical protein